GDLNLSRIRNHVVISQNVAIVVNDESRALSFLGHQAVEEVQGNRARGNVHNRSDVLAINRDVVLLFAIEWFVTGSLGDLHLRRRRVHQPEGSRAIGREVKESTDNQDCDGNRSYQFHATSPKRYLGTSQDLILLFPRLRALWYTADIQPRVLLRAIHACGLHFLEHKPVHAKTISKFLKIRQPELFPTPLGVDLFLPGSGQGRKHGDGATVLDVVG